MSNQSLELPPPRLGGLHHVTAIVADLDRTTSFYRDVLGLTLTAQEDIPDDPGRRHFWFGDAQGTPGTVVSLMEYADMPDAINGRGRRAPLRVSGRLARRTA